MLGTYRTIEYVNPNTGTDETHVLKVLSDEKGIIRVACLFLKNGQTLVRNTSKSTIQRTARPATNEEIEKFKAAFK